jgi:trk system potassium uptake protein TrkA
MSSTYLVIGLGQFGSGLARELAKRGASVIAIDNVKARVDAIGPEVDQALQLDATDANAIAEVEPHRVDAAICAIGAESIEASILVTALLKEHGAPRIITRVTSELQKRIVCRVGADDVVNPESEVARHVAQRVLLPRLQQAFEIHKGLSMAEIYAPKTFVDQPLSNLNLRGRFGVNVVAVYRSNEANSVINPGPDTVINAGDRIALVGSLDDIGRIAKEN